MKNKVNPSGYVAYCNPCNWSTGICVGNIEFDGWDRADIKLRNHKKSITHKRTVPYGR